MNHELQEENPLLEVEKERICQPRRSVFMKPKLWDQGVMEHRRIRSLARLLIQMAVCKWCSTLLVGSVLPTTCREHWSSSEHQWFASQSVKRVKRSVHMEKTRASTDPETKLHISAVGIRRIWDCFYCLTVSWCIAATTASCQIFGRPFATLMGRNCVEASLHRRKDPSHVWRRKYYRD